MVNNLHRVKCIDLYLIASGGSVQGTSQAQEEIAMKKSFTHLCLVASILGMSMAFTDSAVGQERALAAGSFVCRVEVVDSGAPTGNTRIYFDAILGIIGGPVDTGIGIGTGSGLDAICEEQAETIRSLAQTQMCTVSAILKNHYEGGNYSSDIWTFNVLCNSKQTNVIDAIGNIMEGVLIMPISAQ